MGWGGRGRMRSGSRRQRGGCGQRLGVGRRHRQQS
uniref:Uncharacterized protein n=1 Tax=Arundo donax TaxID=35708 RepID=A0A0A9ASK3_ARUDO